MQNIFKNKYLAQKKLVKEHFYHLVSNFSELNQKQIDNLSINIVKNAQNYKAGSPFSKLIHEFSLTSNEGIVLMCLAEAEIGNIYINRNMIGAVVGVQPFGGYEKSGTGPKAGGPEYLKRLCYEQSISNNTASMGGNASLLSEVED
jgi:hypothetical protein